MYANETTAHSRTVSLSERPLKFACTSNCCNNGGPRYSFESNWHLRNYYQSNLIPDTSQVRQLPGFTPFSPYSHNVSYDELIWPRPEFKKLNSEFKKFKILEFESYIGSFETFFAFRFNTVRIKSNLKSSITLTFRAHCHYYFSHSTLSVAEICRRLISHSRQRTCHRISFPF